KFARPGTEVVVHAGLSSTNPAFVYVQVWNDGPIIPRHEHARIFRRFEQGSTAMLTQHRGSGLGLAISASLVEAHQGFIWVDSEEGRGTTFGFAIPCERPSHETVALFTNAESAVYRGTRLLVVDDDAYLAHFLS